MSENVLGTEVVAQIGIIVKDIEKTSKSYADFFGVSKPPINKTDSFEKAQTEYKGKTRSPGKAGVF